MPEQPARAWRLVLEHVERDLLDGRIGPGDRLASERDLAADLGVGRSSVREALRVLEVMGLIRTSTGSGPQSGAIVIATPTGGMSTLLRLQVAAQGFPLADVVQTRLLLEDAVAAALAGQDAPDLVGAHRVLEAMDAHALTPAEFLALDAQLHLALAESSGNTVVAAIMAGLRTAIESYVQQGAAAIDDWGAMADVLRAEHRAIIDAIEAGDATTARSLVRAHITGYYTAAGLTRSTRPTD
ncbi:GntR family transcriptional repressor for pyruvate dehydrogenase complex [Microbacterium foliorum]|jgi:DNA-binding FadR family transcriptional regulator|uniref:GntR family transcriptional repressor for pyruvate dehydrogenase complex n=1 Tax=Microbacterium foliorum TaxID=104336 RepID=A0ABU1HRI1_9MICO|nr:MULTISPECIES: FCD domain-containing protein [Microbacterium]AQY02396.1 GntR family transcriptional regulator [Microbacterium foliorum]KIP92448.1 GntR family transcriptional regulator [Microbacterium sp. MEJ108Y]KQR47702.1 GntR family transcriptional regulator [Microbacterium sp. Leaf161]MDR6142466.1 GntR family transcriptional repressor for pyruvate dehydrogenase complex [Microbacterium foliorum]